MKGQDNLEGIFILTCDYQQVSDRGCANSKKDYRVSVSSLGQSVWVACFTKFVLVIYWEISKMTVPIESGKRAL